MFGREVEVGWEVIPTPIKTIYFLAIVQPHTDSAIPIKSTTTHIIDDRKILIIRCDQPVFQNGMFMGRRLKIKCP